MLAEQAGHAEQQVVEIQGVVGRQELLVFGVDFGDSLLASLFRLGRECSGVGQVVLCPRDGRVDIGGHQVERLKVQLLDGLLDQADLFTLVVDAEIGMQARQAGKFPKQPGTKRVKGADSGAARNSKVGHPLAHLSGGLVGEGDGQDVPGRHALGGKIRHAAGDDASFSRSGPGQYQQRTVDMRDGLSLGIV